MRKLQEFSKKTDIRPGSPSAQDVAEMFEVLKTTAKIKKENSYVNEF
ncbi:MAG: hypothetical protein ABS879_06360 [Eubacteriales bacterium]